MSFVAFETSEVMFMLDKTDEVANEMDQEVKDYGHGSEMGWQGKAWEHGHQVVDKTKGHGEQ